MDSKRYARRWALLRAAIFSLFASALINTQPARADIGAFNDAVRAGDYPRAAEAAVAAWPTLDRSREDFGVIAREFAFAALVASEFDHAHEFAVAARAQPPAGVESSLHEALSEIMMHAALMQSDANRRKRSAARDELRSALQRRGELEGFDLISLVSGNALISYDLDRNDWDEAAADARMMSSLTEQGGPQFQSHARMFELGAISSSAMEGPDVEVAQNLHNFTRKLVKDMESVPTDEQALAILPVYWEAYAWSGAVQSYLWSSNNGIPSGSLFSRRARPGDQECDCDKEEVALPSRMQELLGSEGHNEDCEKEIEIDPPVKFPASARRRGSIGAVLIAVDLDEEGQASNGRLLAGVPEKYFAAAALERVPNMKYSPGETWDPEVCRLEEKHHVIQFVFQIGYR